MGINYSTAKTIWKIYEKEGRVFKKKTPILSNKTFKKEEVDEIPRYKTVMGQIENIVGDLRNQNSILTPGFWGTQLTSYINKSLP